jgi:hypothetical protein
MLPLWVYCHRCTTRNQRGAGTVRWQIMVRFRCSISIFMVTEDLQLHKYWILSRKAEFSYKVIVLTENEQKAQMQRAWDNDYNEGLGPEQNIRRLAGRSGHAWHMSSAQAERHVVGPPLQFRFTSHCTGFPRLADNIVICHNWILKPRQALSPYFE